MRRNSQVRKHIIQNLFLQKNEIIIAYGYKSSDNSLS